MAESPEHQFLKEVFIDILSDFSSLRLFGVTEVQRRAFDFGCSVERDWTRPLMGQVDWRSRGGLDKDLRTLFADHDVDIRVLLMRSNMSNRLQLLEILKAFNERRYDTFTLKVFPVAPDFDADREDHREAVRKDLHDRVAHDILFNVVFGGLAADNVHFFAWNAARLVSVRHLPGFESYGTFGTTLAVLYHLAGNKFISNAEVGSVLRLSPGRVREALVILEGARFIDKFGKASHSWRVTLRGRVFLELLGRVSDALTESRWGGELGYVLARLNCRVDDSLVSGQPIDEQTRPGVLDALLLHIQAAKAQWGFDVRDQIRYRNVVREDPLGQAEGEIIDLDGPSSGDA